MDAKSLLQLEKDLEFVDFQREDALEVAAMIIEKVKDSHTKPIGIQIKHHGKLIFYHLMDGKKESDWLQRKYQTVVTSGHSSLYVFCEAKINERYEGWENNQAMAICGGGFPIIENDKVTGAICVSGLEHTEDHQLIVDALRQHLNK